VDFGVVFPTTRIGTDPAVIRDFAQTAEGLAYRRLLVYDHVLGEPLVLLGFLAACTTTIELEAAVLVWRSRSTCCGCCGPSACASCSRSEAATRPPSPSKP
jgi:hypothetical protein